VIVASGNLHAAKRSTAGKLTTRPAATSLTHALRLVTDKNLSTSTVHMS
jgi:hypothetical protein